MVLTKQALSELTIPEAAISAPSASVELAVAASSRTAVYEAHTVVVVNETARNDGAPSMVGTARTRQRKMGVAVAPDINLPLEDSVFSHAEPLTPTLPAKVTTTAAPANVKHSSLRIGENCVSYRSKTLN